MINVATLKVALRRRNLSLAGNKQQLVARLMQADVDSKLSDVSIHSGAPRDNSPTGFDTEVSSIDTVTKSTAEDSAMVQVVGDDNETVGVEVAVTTAGEEDNLLVRDVSGDAIAPGEDDGQNGAAVCAHSEVEVEVAGAEVAGAGKILLPQLVTSSTVVQVPPLNLAALQPVFPPTTQLTTPTGSSRSSDKSAHDETEHGATSVSTPNASARAQQHSSAGETSIFATPGDVPPPSMGKLVTELDFFCAG
jgi:hypothetical protein